MIILLLMLAAYHQLLHADKLYIRAYGPGLAPQNISVQPFLSSECFRTLRRLQKRVCARKVWTTPYIGSRIARHSRKRGNYAGVRRRHLSLRKEAAGAERKVFLHVFVRVVHERARGCSKSFSYNVYSQLEGQRGGAIRRTGALGCSIGARS